MNPWPILEIAPTREEREIKRAYTRKLRQHPPETDPAGFQSLRAAYETALFYARLPMDAIPLPAADQPASASDIPIVPGQDPVPGRPTSAAPSEPSAEPAPGRESESRPPQVPPPGSSVRPLRADAPPEWLPEAQTLLRRIRDDFPDHSKRQFKAYWESVLDIPLLWNLDAKGWLGWNLFAFLGEAARNPVGLNSDVHIGKEAWIFLDATFGWLENETQLYAAFPEEIANPVLDPIRAANGLQQSVDLGIPNPKASALADLRERSYIPKGLGPMIGLAALVLSNLIHDCGQDTPRRRSVPAAIPAPSRSSYPFPEVTPKSPPQVHLKTEPPFLEDAPPPPTPQR